MKDTRTLLVIQAVLTLLVGLTYFCVVAVSAYGETVEYCTCILMVLTGLWTVMSWRWASGSIFGPFGLFLISSLLFNSGTILLEVFGLNEAGPIPSNVSLETAVKTVFMVALATMCLQTGGMLAIEKARSKAKAGPVKKQTDGQHLRQVGWVLIGVSFLPACYMLSTTLNTVKQSGYAGVLTADQDHGWAAVPARVALFLVPGALFLLAGSKGRRSSIVFATAIVSLYALMYLYIGARQASAMSLIALVWLIHTCIRRVPMSLLGAAGLAAVLFVFPFIHELRENSSSDYKNQSEKILAFFSEKNPAVLSLAEMGWTVTILAEVHDMVPELRSYDYGMSYLYAASTLFPNLFWDEHPAITAGTPDRWFSRMHDPNKSVSAMTFGFSYLGEAYLNFGLFGILIVPFIIGFGLGWLNEGTALGQNLALCAATACLLSGLLVYARSDTNSIFRTAGWYTLIPYGASLALKRLRDDDLRLVIETPARDLPLQRMSA